MTEIRLPWPPRELSPNARVHWSKRSKAAAAYRSECGWIVRAAIAKAPDFKPPDSERIALWIDFFPPDRRHRDDDNLLAAFKAGRDGIADALGINDKRFVSHPFVQDVTGGYVRVRITGMPESDAAMQVWGR